jgi:hypothetical protein
VSGPREIELRAYIQDGQNEIRKRGIWTGSVTTTGFPSLALNVVIKTISGTIGPVTINNAPVGYVSLSAMDSGGTTLLGDTETTSGGSWAIDVGDYIGDVKFFVGGFSSLTGLLIMDPTLYDPGVPVNTGGNTGITLAPVNIPTHDVTVTVTDNSSDIPAAVGITKTPLTIDELNLPAYALVTVPGGDFSMSFKTGAQTLPVANGFPTNLHFVVLTTNGNVYVTTAAVNTAAPVTLDIGDMHFIANVDY